jgi:hypothetical protein
MRNVNFLLVVLLLMGSLFLSPASVSAQTPIVPVDPSYVDSVEVYVGTSIPEGRVPAQLDDVRFTVPAGLLFTSATLTNGSSFSLPEVSGIGTEKLDLTINFYPRDGIPPGQDLLDTLKISASSGDPFVLPLRGTAVTLAAIPSSVLFSQSTVPGDTTTLPEVVLITTLDVTANNVVYSFGTDAFYAELASNEPGVPVSRLFLDLFFTPPGSDPGDITYSDTLTVTNLNDTTGYVLKVPVSAHSVHIAARPNPLDFGEVMEDFTETLDLFVEVRGASITGIALSDMQHFSYETDSINWNPTSGGVVHVTFKPDAVRNYTADLVFLGDDFTPYNVFLIGQGTVRPKLSADPTEVDFGEVEVGSTAQAEVTVTLTYPMGSLDENNFSLADQDGIFSIVSVVPDAKTDTSIVVIATLAFAPDAADTDFTNTLIVQADYAVDLKVPLLGFGIDASAPSLSPQQATAISGPAAAAPALSVREGEIVVSHAPAGSSIEVYNLAGQSLKTQAVASDTEVLKTASLPQSVYIVLVNDRDQEIIRQKVIL